LWAENGETQFHWGRKKQKRYCKNIKEGVVAEKKNGGGEEQTSPVSMIWGAEQGLGKFFIKCENMNVFVKETETAKRESHGKGDVAHSPAKLVPPVGEKEAGLGSSSGEGGTETLENYQGQVVASAGEDIEGGTKKRGETAGQTKNM